MTAPALAATGPADLRDARRLAALEQTIESGLTSFVAVGEALIEVRDSRLYRLTYPTFEAYCKGRWKFTARHAGRLMEAAEVVGEIGPIGPIPTTESQARELAPVLREHGPEVAAAVMAEATEASNGHAPTAAAIRAVVVGPGATRPKWNPGAAVMSSDSPEWYTPRHILDAVVVALGAIDLDPCADPGHTVPAERHLAIGDDGLTFPWLGRVYMNPPYGRSIGDWTGKLRAEFRDGRTSEAIALLPARTETDWWASLDAEWICFVHGRLAFSDSDTSAPFPSAAVYLGPRGEAFAAAFAAIGPTYRRWQS